MQERKLHLAKAYNVRDLGGYSNAENRVIPYQVFFRGDDISKLTEEDMEILRANKIQTVIDLRSEREVSETGYVLTKNEEFQCINIPLHADGVDDASKQLQQDPEKFLPQFYIACLERAKDQIYEVFQLMGEENTGGILFHCAAGKDRTGVISALLLSLAGVERHQVLNNYESTYENNSQNPAYLENQLGFPKELLYSKREYMEEALNHLKTNYSSAEEYLLTTTLTCQEINKVKNKLLGI